MKFAFPLIEARLIKREKRFLAYAKLKDGVEVIAHCPNPGSMKGNANPDAKIWLLDFGKDFKNTGKKLRYKWVFVESDGVKVCLDTNLANHLVAEALEQKKIP